MPRRYRDAASAIKRPRAAARAPRSAAASAGRATAPPRTISSAAGEGRAQREARPHASPSRRHASATHQRAGGAEREHAPRPQADERAQAERPRAGARRRRATTRGAARLGRERVEQDQRQRDAGADHRATEALHGAFVHVELLAPRGLAVVELAHRVAPQQRPSRRGACRRRTGAPDSGPICHMPTAADDDAEQADTDRVPARPEVARDEREERQAVDAGERVERLVELGASRRAARSSGT